MAIVEQAQDLMRAPRLVTVHALRGRQALTMEGPIREVKPRSVLSDADVAEIRRLAGDGGPQVELARRYGVHPSHVSDIISGRRRRLSKE